MYGIESPSVRESLRYGNQKIPYIPCPRLFLHTESLLQPFRPSSKVRIEASGNHEHGLLTCCTVFPQSGTSICNHAASVCHSIPDTLHIHYVFDGPSRWPGSCVAASHCITWHFLIPTVLIVVVFVAMHLHLLAMHHPSRRCRIFRYSDGTHQFTHVLFPSFIALYRRNTILSR